jgi:hypothetical protein
MRPLKIKDLTHQATFLFGLLDVGRRFDPCTPYHSMKGLPQRGPLAFLGLCRICAVIRRFNGSQRTEALRMGCQVLRSEVRVAPH